MVLWLYLREKSVVRLLAYGADWGKSSWALIFSPLEGEKL